MQDRSEARPWRPVEELVEIGFSRSRVMMMNEVHRGLLRCVRTRIIGRSILPTAHRLGVRHLAMEALYPEFAEEANRTRQLPEPETEHPEQELGHLAQPEMRAFVQEALDLGWTLVPYEADFSQEPPNLSERGKNNWREEMQARNLISALNELSGDAKLLVWCGNNHHTKTLVRWQSGQAEEDWALMGYHFRALSGIDPFVIDQGRTVVFPGMKRRPAMQQWLDEVTPQLKAFGGTAGFLAEEAPPCFAGIEGDDAYIISLENEME